MKLYNRYKYKDALCMFELEDRTIFEIMEIKKSGDGKCHIYGRVALGIACTAAERFDIEYEGKRAYVTVNGERLRIDNELPFLISKYAN